MLYEIVILSPAVHALKKIPNPDKERIRQRIRALAENPRPAGIKKILGDEDLYRIRSGDYRIVYQIEDNVLLVLVVRVAHRKDVYK